MISPCPLSFSYMCWGPVKLWYSCLTTTSLGGFGWFWVVPWGSHYFLRQPPHFNHLNHLPTPPSPAFLAWFRLPPHRAPCAGRRPGANPRWRGRSEWRTAVSRWRCPTESRLTRIQHCSQPEGWWWVLISPKSWRFMGIKHRDESTDFIFTVAWGGKRGSKLYVVIYCYIIYLVIMYYHMLLYTWLLGPFGHPKAPTSSIG